MAGIQEARTERLEELERKAKDSPMKESYLLISTDGAHRLGLSIRALPDGSLAYSMELLVCALGADLEVDVPRLENAIRMTKALERLGYHRFHKEDGWVCWERELTRGDIEAEFDTLARLIEGPVGGQNKKREW